MTRKNTAIVRAVNGYRRRGAARRGARRYGEELIPKLSADLQARFGRGYGRANLFQMKAFYLAHRETLQTASGQSTDGANLDGEQRATSRCTIGP